MPEVPHSKKRRFFGLLDAPAPTPWWSTEATFFQGGTSGIVYPWVATSLPLYHLPDEQLHKFDIILREKLVFAQITWIIIGVFLYRIHVSAGVLIWQ